MAKIAVLLVVVLVTGLAAPMSARAEVAADYGGDYGGPPIALAFILTNGPLVSCYDMAARLGSTGARLTGRTYMVNNSVLAQGQAVVGFAYLDGEQIVFGFEAFPTAASPAAQVAAKIGGAIALATLLGTGLGYHFLGTNIIPFGFQVRLAVQNCQTEVA
jgi:hypothetical protein